MKFFNNEIFLKVYRNITFAFICIAKYSKMCCFNNINISNFVLTIGVIQIFYKTRIKTSISSKAFCSINDRQTDKIFTE